MRARHEGQLRNGRWHRHQQHPWAAREEVPEGAETQLLGLADIHLPTSNELIKEVPKTAWCRLLLAGDGVKNAHRPLACALAAQGKVVGDRREGNVLKAFGKRVMAKRSDEGAIRQREEIRVAVTGDGNEGAVGVESRAAATRQPPTVLFASG